MGGLLFTLRRIQESFVFSRLQAHNNCYCLRTFCISRLSRCFPSHSSSFVFLPKCRCSIHPLPLLTLISFCVSYASPVSWLPVQFSFLFCVAASPWLQSQGTFLLGMSCQTSILRNFENRFLPFSVASTLSLVSALCCCPHACRPPGNFRFEFQCSRLVIMRVRFSRRLPPLAVFFTIFARPVTPCTFHFIVSSFRVHIS